MILRCLDLFSGIGGFALGFAHAGISTEQFVEVDPFCREVLSARFPGVPIHDDVRTYRASPGEFDVICGGFPCQDISVAGKGAGLSGERSGLWREYRRIIEEARPRYVVIENSPALRRRGLGEVLRDLLALGHDAEWHCLPASAVGAPHRRDRMWVIACPAVAYSPVARLEAPAEGCLLSPRWWEEGRAASLRSGWPAEPPVGRVAHGVPRRVDRLRALGNAVVPTIPEIIGRAIVQHHESMRIDA